MQAAEWQLFVPGRPNREVLKLGTPFPRADVNRLRGHRLDQPTEKLIDPATDRLV